MRRLLLISFFLLYFSAAGAMAQGGLRMQASHTSESLRGVSAVSRQVAWASGTHGTYLRTTDGGATWIPAQVPDAGSLDFRGVVAFSANEAFLMSAGPGEQSRIYHTSDAGQHWTLQFTNTNPKGFFDSMVFWNPKHGLVLGDPVEDEKGKLKFEVLLTEDGQNWHPIPAAQLPDAMEGEGAFAASNTCIAIVPSTASSMASSTPDGNVWFATGGKVARVFHSADGGKSWRVFNTAIVNGLESTGIFSIAFRDDLHGVIAGGDYKHPNADGPNLAFTEDGGESWTLSSLHPLAYFSAVAYDRRMNGAAIKNGGEQNKARVKPVDTPRLFIVGQNFLLDLRLPHRPQRVGGGKKPGIGFNAISADPEGGALVVGPKGTIAFIP